MDIVVGHPSLIVLAGPSGIGKSTWAARVVPETAVVSSDWARGRLVDDEADQTVHAEAFALVHYLAAQRLRLGKSVVIDSTALVRKDRAALLEIATETGVEAHLVVVAGTEAECMAGQASRERQVPEKVVKRHVARLDGLLREIARGETMKEGFESVHVIRRSDMDDARLVFETAAASGYDVIGDVHGSAAETVMLLDRLGYRLREGAYEHPEGRVAVFVGDLTDRGPANMEALRLVHRMTQRGSAVLGALGNHDSKLHRLMIQGRDVQIGHGLDRTVAEFEALSHEGRAEIRRIVGDLFDNVPAYSTFDDGSLVVTHGAIRREMVGRGWARSRRDPVSTMCLFGETAGFTPENRPIRIYDWVAGWDGSDATVVFGHDVVGFEPRWMSDNVLGIDTGCAFGGRLSAFRYPERETVQVPSLTHEITHEALV